MSKGKLFLVVLFITAVPTLLAPFAVAYIGVLPRGGIAPVFLNPATVSVIILYHLAILFVVKRNTGKILNYDGGESGAAEVLKNIVKTPRKILLSSMFYGIIVPLAAARSIGIMSGGDLIILFASAVFMTGIPFYIMFIRIFEKEGSKIPFDNRYISMSITVRFTLVISLTLFAMIALQMISVKYFVMPSGGEAVSVNQAIIKKIFPINGIGIVLTIINILLLFTGVNKRINDCKSLAIKLAEGVLSSENLDIDSRDELGSLKNSLNMVKNNTMTLIKGITGQFRSHLEIKDRLSSLSGGNSSSVGRIAESVEKVRRQTEVLNENVINTVNSSAVLSEQIGIMHKKTSEQGSVVRKTSETTKEMLSSLNSISNSSRDKIEKAKSLIDVSARESRNLSETVSYIDEININIKKIHEILEIISDISKRTNMLAMNAAIEAAHAGEAGKGFGVVSDEIRKLADSTAVSTSEIVQSIAEITDTVAKVSGIGSETARNYEAIHQDIIGVIESFREIEERVVQINTDGRDLFTLSDQLKSISGSVTGNTGSMRLKIEEVDRIMSALKKISEETQDAVAFAGSAAKSISESSGELNVLTEELEKSSLLMEKEINRFTF